MYLVDDTIAARPHRIPQSAEVSQFYVLPVSMNTGLIFLYCNFTGELTWIQAALHIPLIWKGFGLGPNA